MKKLIAGNWKMNGSVEQTMDIVSGIDAQIKNNPSLEDNCEFLICPPSPYLLNIKSDIVLGAQDCSEHDSGAYTGEVSAAMVKDCGGSYVILGHSERRQYHGEVSELVARKAMAAHAAGLVAIICVGETEDQRAAAQEETIVAKQLIESIPKNATSHNTVIAYEPVWAIGTGKTASRDDVVKMHGFIRNKLQDSIGDADNVRILYGGSMKPENAANLLSTPNVDGGLIGGASLKYDQFIKIGLAAPKI